MILQCNYFERLLTKYQYKFYCCEVKDQEILEDEDIEFIGIHENYKTNIDVTYIYFYNCTLNKLPPCLSKKFPNLKGISVYSSKLKSICSSDLKVHKDLIMLSCFNSEIEFLPGNLFEDSKRIEWIMFENNKKLKFIEPNLLNNLENLKRVEIKENLNLDINFSNFPNETTEQTLEDVKNELADKFFSFNSETVKEFVLKLENPLDNFKEYLRRVKTSEAKIKILEMINEITEDILKQKVEKGYFRDIQKFTQDEATKDFNIIIDNHEFPVHKFLLAARSPTLAELLKNNPEVENLNLVDISVEIFEIILKFLYTDELPGDDGTNFLHLFVASGRLKINQLKYFAADKILKNISTLSSVELLKIATKYEHDEMIQKAFQEIKKKYPKIPFKDEWSRDLEMLVKVIQAFEKKEEEIKRLETEFENLAK